MYIIGKTKPDKSGRVLLTNFYKDAWPKEVTFVFDSKTEVIEILDDPDNLEFGSCHPIDEKCRAFLPKWIREEFSEKDIEFFLVIENGRKFLSPKTQNLF